MVTTSPVKAQFATLGRLIAAGRKMAGLDQDELGEIVGCGREVLSDWETGKVRRFQRAILLGIIRALGPHGEAIATKAVRLHILGVDATKLPALGWVPRPPRTLSDARLTATRDSQGRVTDDLDGRSAAELRLLLRGAIMGEARPDRLLHLLDALERALEREKETRT